MAPHTRGTRLGTSNAMCTATVLRDSQSKVEARHPTPQIAIWWSKHSERGMQKCWGWGRGCQGTVNKNVRKWESKDNPGLVTGSLSPVTTLRGQISRDGFTRKDLTCLTRGFVLDVMGSSWRLLKRGGGGDGVRFAFRANTEKYHYGAVYHCIAIMAHCRKIALHNF